MTATLHQNIWEHSTHRSDSFRMSELPEDLMPLSSHSTYLIYEHMVVIGGGQRWRQSCGCVLAIHLPSTLCTEEELRGYLSCMCPLG